MSNGFTIYALRGDENNPECAAMLYSSLQEGEGRFGWSSIETGDLNKLKQRIEQDGWDSLSDDERECYQAFLLDIREGDYVIYINCPSGGSVHSRASTDHIIGAMKMEISTIALALIPIRFMSLIETMNSFILYSAQGSSSEDDGGVSTSSSILRNFSGVWKLAKGARRLHRRQPVTCSTRQSNRSWLRLQRKFTRHIQTRHWRTCLPEFSGTFPVSIKWRRKVVQEIAVRICWWNSNRGCPFHRRPVLFR